MNKTSKKKVFLAGLIMLTGGIGFYLFLKDLLNFDIDWSVSLAQLYCKKVCSKTNIDKKQRHENAQVTLLILQSEWVRKSTLPLSSIIRTSICIMSYGLFKNFRSSVIF